MGSRWNIRGAASGALLLALMAWCACAPCWAARRRPSNQQQQQNAAAQNQQNQLNANAAAAQANSAAARQATAAAGAELRQAQQDANDAVAALRKIEAELEDAESPSTDCGKARDAYRKAKEDYEAAKAKALDTPEFKDKLEEVQADGGTGAALKKVTVDNDPGAKEALEALNAAKAKYEPLRQAMFQANDRWKEANATLQEKSRVVHDLEHGFDADREKRARSAGGGAERRCRRADPRRRHGRGQTAEEPKESTQEPADQSGPLAVSAIGKP